MSVGVSRSVVFAGPLGTKPRGWREVFDVQYDRDYSHYKDSGMLARRLQALDLDRG